MKYHREGCSPPLRWACCCIRPRWWWWWWRTRWWPARLRANLWSSWWWLGGCTLRYVSCSRPSPVCDQLLSVLQSDWEEMELMANNGWCRSWLQGAALYQYCVYQVPGPWPACWFCISCLSMIPPSVVQRLTVENIFTRCYSKSLTRHQLPPTDM